jgi:hypothetical protein
MSLTKATYSMIDGAAINIRDYGATGDGVTDDSAAVLAAFNAAKAAGKSLYVPVGIYNIATTISVSSLRNITVFGEGSPVDLDTTKASYFRFTGTSGNMFYFDHLAGVEFRDIWFGYNSGSYSNDLVRTDNSGGLDSTYNTWNRCVFSGEGAGINATSLLKLEKTIVSSINRCLFTKANNGVALLTYCNVITFRENTFYDLNFRSVYVFTGACESLMFYDNTFEPTADGKATGVFCVNNELILNLVYIGNWHGDVSVNGGTGWLTLGIIRGAIISGNLFSTPGTGAADYCIIVNNASSGIQISGNSFYDKALVFGAATTGVNITSNVFYAANAIYGLNFIAGKSVIASNTGYDGLPRCKTFTTGNQSIPTSTHTAVAFDGEYYDQGAIHSVSVNNTRFTVPVGGAGLYSFSGNALFNSGAGTMWGRILKNGTVIVSSVVDTLDPAAAKTLSTDNQDVAADGDYYEFTVWQNTGGALNVLGNVNSAADTTFTVSKVFSGD